MSRRGPYRHRGLIVESIPDAAGGVQSLSERDFEGIVGDQLVALLRRGGWSG